jgi:hypothetical protein
MERPSRRWKTLKHLLLEMGFSEGPRHLPNSLRVLKWQGYPLPSLPHYFNPMKLSILELPDSCLKPCKPIQASGFVTVCVFMNFH